MLRKTAILLNIIWFGFWTWLGIEEGLYGMESWETFMFFLVMLLAPIINIFAITLGKDTWITLYFKRKALEEKRKISEISDKTERD